MGVLTLLVAIVASGCDRGLTPPPCECPILEEAVDAINWAPGGQLRQAEASRTEDGMLVQYVWEVEAAEASGSLERIDRALSDAGFSVQEEPSSRLRANREDLEVWAGTNQAVDQTPATLFVRVTFDGEDSPEVADLLEPLRRQLEDT